MPELLTNPRTVVVRVQTLRSGESEKKLSESLPPRTLLLHIVCTRRRTAFRPVIYCGGGAVTTPIRPCECSVSLLHCSHRKCIITSFLSSSSNLSSFHFSKGHIGRQEEISSLARSAMSFESHPIPYNLLALHRLPFTSLLTSDKPPFSAYMHRHRLPHICRGLVNWGYVPFL